MVRFPNLTLRFGERLKSLRTEIAVQLVAAVRTARREKAMHTCAFNVIRCSEM